MPFPRLRERHRYAGERRRKRRRVRDNSVVVSNSLLELRTLL